MIDREYGGEQVGVMAVLTNVAGLDVRWMFADGIAAIVAAHAVAADVDMVEVRR